MPWIKEVCEDVVCGTFLGILKGACGVSLFTAPETEEINSLKQLTISVMEKSPQIVTDRRICDGIRQAQKSALEEFVKTAPPEAIAAGVVSTAQVVCTKSFKQRFASVLTGACLNLVGC